jgi:hypothetical protein
LIPPAFISFHAIAYFADCAAPRFARRYARRFFCAQQLNREREVRERSAAAR